MTTIAAHAENQLNPRAASVAERIAGLETERDWIGLVAPGVSIPFDSIRSPGTYICNWNGHLLRIPAAALVPNGVMNLVGPEPLFVTKISDDPDLPVVRARQIATRLQLEPTF